MADNETSRAAFTAACMDKLADYKYEYQKAILLKRKELMNKNIQEVGELQKELDDVKGRYANLGLFSFGEKKTATQEMSAIVGKMNELLSDKCIESEMKSAENSFANEYKDYESKMTEYLENRFPYEREYKSAKEKYMPTGSGDKATILKAIAHLGRCSVNDIVQYDPNLNALGIQRTSALIRQLKDEGMVIREAEGATAYFTLTDDPEERAQKNLAKRGITKEYMDPKVTDDMCPVPPEIRV